MMVPPFREGQRVTAAQLNRLVEAVNEANLRAGPFMRVEGGRVGKTVSLSLEELLPRIPKTPRRDFWAEIVEMVDPGPDGAYIYTVKLLDTEEEVEATEMNHVTFIPAGTKIHVHREKVAGEWAWKFVCEYVSWWGEIQSCVGGHVYNTVERGGGRTGEASEVNSVGNIPDNTVVRIFNLQPAHDVWLFEYAGEDREVKGGPGIDVSTATPGEVKVSADLAATPGLEFIGAGDAGKLAVKPNADKAVVVEAAGVGVVADTDKAIVVTAAGVGVVADTEKGIVVAAAGVGVVANIPEAIAVDAQGVKWMYDTDKGLGVENNLAVVKPHTLAGIKVDADGVGATLDTVSGLAFGITGLIQIRLSADEDGGLEAENVDGWSLHLKHQPENVTKISIYEDGGNLAARVWKGGVEIENSPNNNVIMEFDDAGRIKDADFG